MDKMPSFELDDGSLSSRRPVLFTLVCWVLAVMCGALSVILAIGGALSSDSCRPGDAEFICTAAGQNLAWWLPFAGYAAASVVAWISVELLECGARPKWLGLLAGAAVFAAVATIDLTFVVG
ncbi:hypothetical protein [Amycolatopsis sp. NPDC004378]